jgi:LPXTG-site transpeptidase (sortase) family protein
MQPETRPSPGLTYYNLSTSTGGTKTLGSATIVNNTLTIGAATTLNTSNNNLSFAAFTNNGTFTAGSSNISIIGTLTTNIPTFSTTGTVTMAKTAGTATLTGNVSAASLTINGVGGTLNLGTGLTHQVNGPITFTNGTLNGGTNSTLSLTGNFTGNGGTFTAGTGTVAFNGSLAQTINRNVAIVFNNLIINNSSGVVNNHTGATTVNGTLTLTNGIFTLTTGLTMGNGATISRDLGSLSAAPTFGATVNVTYTGATAVTTGPEIPAAATVLNNLTVNKTGGVTLNSAPTVNGVLTLTSGVVTTGANTLIIATGGSVGGASTNSYVIGNLEKVFPLGASSFTFDIGDATRYVPLSLSFANVTSTGNVTASTTPGQHPNIATSEINPARDVNRFWTLTPAGGLAFTTYDAVFTFVPADILGGANPANFIVQRFSGGWTTPTIGTRTATSTQATGLNAMGSFAAGEAFTTPSTTVLACVPDPVLFPAASSCTVTVSRVSGTHTPSGTVTFSSSGTGGFTPDNSCILSGSGGSATCSVTYTATSIGTGTHTLAASYPGDVYFDPSSGTFDLTVNDPPTTTGISDVAVNEDAANTTIDLWPSFADSEDSDGSLVYTLTGNTDPGLFTSVTITGTPNQYLVLDYSPDQNGSSLLTVRATDSDLLWVETSFTVTIDPVNDPPTVLGPLPNLTATEDDPDLPVDLSAVFGDVDIATNADSLTLAIAFNSNPGLVTASLVGSTLTLDFQPDQNGTATLRVRATDLAGAFAEDEFLVTVDPVNDPPTDIGLTSDHLAENLPPATTVGILSTIDGDPGDTFVYSLVDSLACPGPDNVSFQIGGAGLNELQSAVSFDYETRATYTVCVRTTDSGGASLERQFVIAIDDVDDLPPAVVSILRQAPAASPTGADNLTFRVTFSEAVQSVSLADFDLAATGTAAASLSAVNMLSADVYDVLLTAAAGNGSLDLQFTLVNDIQDLAGNALGGTPSVGLQESYLLDNQGILINSLGVLGLPGSLPLTDGGSYTTHFTSLTIAFDSDAADPPGDLGADDVSNPANYLLLTPGTNGSFDSPDCLSAPGADDGIVPTGPAVYVSDSGTGEYITTLTLNGGLPLPSGNYRLLLCGTTSITDLFGNPLNDGVDERIDFRIYDPAQPSRLPRTGFAPGKVTLLPEQTAGYSALGDLWLDIPRLGVQMPIVGVPLVNGDWDVTWLGADAGWLEGSAYPTGNGNSVLTGHVYDAYGRPGPFAGLNTLRWGDRVVVHAGGVEYVYVVRQLLQVSPGNVNALLKHEELPWITLVTCRGYDPVRAEYRYRVLVRAVLVEIR